ncbi:MAG: LPP20 family lipoprotein [Flavobacteriia bacterium]|nr:LPP20 family lipoprotein [Flavobacteriia bacterium]
MKFKLYIASIFLAFGVLSGCGSSETVSSGSSSTPEWTQSKPSDPFAYVGIGVARIQSDGSHLQTAKNAALSDLASEISVEISSTSLLHQMETNRQFREEFRAQTEINSYEDIEGFELAGSYEGKDYYWVQYKLDKAEYARIRANRKESAVSRAVAFYNLAKESARANEIQPSLAHAFSALSELKPYLNEPIRSEQIEGDFGIRLYAFVDSILGSIRVVSLQESFEIVRFAEPPHRAYFQVQDTRGQWLENIPVYLYYTGGFLRNSQTISQSSGLIPFALPPADAQTRVERLEADVNYVALAENATRDPLLRMMISRFPSKKALVRIEVRSPKVFISSSEFSGENEMNSPPITQALRRFLLSQKFQIVQDQMDADMTVEIYAKSTFNGRQNEMYLTQLSGEIRILDDMDRLQRSFPLDGYRGVQLSEELSAQDAYRRAIRELEDHEFRKLFLN